MPTKLGSRFEPREQNIAGSSSRWADNRFRSFDLTCCEAVWTVCIFAFELLEVHVTGLRILDETVL